MLTVRGKALEAGADGDVVNVLNVQSKRTVQAHRHRPRPRHRRRRPRRIAARRADRSPTIAARVLRHPVRVPDHAYRVSSSLPSCSPLVAALLGGCSALDRLKNVGEQPPLSAIENPTAQPGYKPVQMPMPAPQPASYNPNSLWRNGSRAFFKDQRAHQVGDILTVKVNITDKATIANETAAQPRRTRKIPASTISSARQAADHRTRDAADAHLHRRIRRARATARARSTARKRCSPTSPAWSRRCCRTATW